MLSYWFPTPLLFRWPLAFSIVFAVGGAISVFVRVTPHGEERNADRIRAIYSVGFRLATVRELVMYPVFAGIWSLGTAPVAVNAIMSGVIVVAVVVLAAGAVLDLQEERGYQMVHWCIRPADEPMLSRLSHVGAVCPASPCIWLSQTLRKAGS